MRTAFLAVWYERAKVEARATARGWKEADGGLLDIYNPEEDPDGSEQLECPDLKSAETHLRNIITDGREFWGQGTVREFEVGGARCRYCTCRGWRMVREHVVEENGIVQTVAGSECSDDDA